MAHQPTGVTRVDFLVEHQLLRFLQTQLVLELQRTQERCQSDLSDPIVTLTPFPQRMEQDRFRPICDTGNQQKIAANRTLD